MPVMKPKNVALTTIGEGGLILLVGAAGWAAHMPFLFASLGPTAYELVEKPASPSAKGYNIVAGHYCALGAAFLSLWIFKAWNAPKVGSAEFVASPRLWAAVLAVVITTAVTLLIQASQPASLSTALLVTLGVMQTKEAAIAILIGVAIMAVAGDPIRRAFLRLGNRT